MAEIHLKQVRSNIGANKAQLASLRSLKLGKIGRSSTVSDAPQTQGMIRSISHLVEVDGGESK